MTPDRADARRGRAGRAVAAVRAVALAALALLAASPAPAAEDDVLLEAAADLPRVALGDDVVLTLTARNRSTRSVEVPIFRLAQDSVAVRVGWGGDTRATVVRVHGRWADDGGTLRLLPLETGRRVLAPGETYTGTVSFSAVVAGELSLLATWGAGDEQRRAARPVSVEVTTRPGAARRLTATVETSLGAFAVELDGAAAFNSVAHFWKLARDGFYDGLTFHRVEPGLLVQGGCPRGDGSGGTGFHLPHEGDLRTPARGVFGLARGAHADSSSSQFFAISDPGGRAAKTLRAEFTTLGRVAEGQEVVDALANVEVDGRTGRPRTPPTITTVRTAVR